MQEDFPPNNYLLKRLNRDVRRAFFHSKGRRWGSHRGHAVEIAHLPIVNEATNDQQQRTRTVAEDSKRRKGGPKGYFSYRRDLDDYFTRSETFVRLDFDG